MRLSDRVAIARQNIIAGKAFVWKMIFGMMFIVMLLISFTVLYVTFLRYNKEFGDSNVRDCYYYTEYRDVNISVDKIEEMINKAKNIGKENGASETSIFYTIDYKDDEMSLGTSQICLQINNQLYEHKSKYVYDSKFYEDMYSKNSPIYMMLYMEGMNVFPEFVQKRNNREFMMGRLPEKPGEIMLDTHFLQTYGISVNEDLLNSRFSMVYHGEEGEKLLIEEYVITGIFNSQIIGARESMNTVDYHIEHIYINLKPDDMTDYCIIYGSERFYQKDYLDYVKNCNYVDELLSLDIEELENEQAEVILTPKGIEYCLLYWLMNDIGRLLIIVAAVVGVIITFSIFYIFRFYRSRNEKYFSMLENIGMNMRDRHSILSMEIGIIIFTATILGIYLSAMFLLLVNILLKSILGFSISLNAPLCIGVVSISWIYFAICVVVVQMVGRKNKN